VIKRIFRQNAKYALNSQNDIVAQKRKLMIRMRTKAVVTAQAGERKKELSQK